MGFFFYFEEVLPLSEVWVMLIRRPNLFFIGVHTDNITATYEENSVMFPSIHCVNDLFGQERIKDNRRLHLSNRHLDLTGGVCRKCGPDPPQPWPLTCRFLFALTVPLRQPCCIIHWSVVYGVFRK